MKRRHQRERSHGPREPRELPISPRSYLVRSILGLLPVAGIAAMMAFAPLTVDHSAVPVEYTSDPAPATVDPSPVPSSHEPGKPMHPEDLVFGPGPLARDLADWVSAPALEHLHALSKNLETQTGIQLGVLVVPNLGGQDIEGFSIKAARAWALGQKKKDNGILLLVARAERRVRIEVGRGLEGDLTDLRSHRIIDETMLPLFKRGEVDNALTAGVEAIIHVVAPKLTVDHRDFSPPTPTPARPAHSFSPTKSHTESYPGHGAFLLLFGLLFAYTGWRVVVLRHYRWLWAIVAALGMAFLISVTYGGVLSLMSVVMMGTIAGLVHGSSSGTSSSSWSSSSSSSSSGGGGGSSSSGSSNSSGGGGSFGGGGASGRW